LALREGEIWWTIEERSFSHWTLTKALLNACGGDYNSFFIHACQLPLWRVLFLIEVRNEALQESQSKQESE
jgi:hypothetical protein